MTAQTAPKLDLISQGEFAALSLHQKNDYLHDLARRFAEATNRPPTPLTPEGLARLRRFYA
ncbi:MAG TPA: hypothetical protein PK264_01940, partial [Hyphomicrobiaceae bacterium]|nr:hypothetical protein [Hyphomicrobiaceae bacterium]